MEDVVGDIGAAGVERADVGVVDPEHLALAGCTLGVARVGERDLVDGVLTEHEWQHDLADVVEQPCQVRGLDRGAAALGCCCGAGRDRDGVGVHLPARHAPAAGCPLEVAIGGGLQGDLAEAAPTDHRERLADRLGPDRARHHGGVGEAQQVCRESLVVLDRGDQLCGRGLRVVGKGADLSNGAVEHGQRPEPLQLSVNPRIECCVHPCLPIPGDEKVFDHREGVVNPPQQ